MTVELVCVGTEILLGNIVNTNAAYLAEQCAMLGLSCYHQSVVGDNEQRMEETICKIVDLEREINADIDRLVDLKAEARKAINAVSDPVQQLILELRYLCYKPWLEIMEELGLSETSIYRIHGEALKNFVVPRKDC